MMIEVLKSKIHCVTVTEANLNYMGSITIDEDIMDAANMIAGEKVQIVDNNNGERFETYIIKGERARAAEESGADSVSLINTLLGMAIDAERKRPILSTVTGGMSGAAVKPIALRMVWQVAKAVNIPVIGLGGIMNWKDAVEFMLAGASAIQIGTANFIDPAVTIKVEDGINNYLERHGCKSVKEIIGALEV